MKEKSRITLPPKEVLLRDEVEEKQEEGMSM